MIYRKILNSYPGGKYAMSENPVNDMEYYITSCSRSCTNTITILLQIMFFATRFGQGK